MQRSAASRPGAPPSFVELIAPAANLAECVVELEGPRGGRMRLQFRAGAPPDLAALGRLLWGR